MQHEIIMPALGMSQDTGTLLAWHKSEGEAVAAGDILFEVETDKTTMEVEAPAAGYLVGVNAVAGAEIPVGNVIAFIADTADSVVTAANAPSIAAPGDAPKTQTLPEGSEVIMPTLGMAQDSGLLISWAKQPGDKVDAEDVLFEVETDKSIAEVTAGHSGYLAARLAAAGEDIPTGAVIAIIAAEPVDSPIDRNFQVKTAERQPAAEPATEAVTAAPASSPAAAPLSLAPVGQRVLASPKLKRAASQAGLDLQLLVDAGVPQPYHFSDLAKLKELNSAANQPQPTIQSQQMIEVSASVPAKEFTAFMQWLAANTGISNEAQVLASLLGSSAAEIMRVGVASLGETQVYRAHQQISMTAPSEEAEELHLLDLRGTFIDTAKLATANVPQITLLQREDQLQVQLVTSATQLSSTEALSLINNFAERLADPMRQLL